MKRPIEFDVFKRIASEYEGVITESDQEIKITANNKIASYYQDGTVHREKIVKCELRLKVYENDNGHKRLSFQGEEKTYEILGGFGGSWSEESMRYNLERYKFKKKIADGQLTFFDLL